MQAFSLYLWMQGGEPEAVLTVRLFKSRVSPLQNPQVGDFDEADFSGYQRAPFPPAEATQFLADNTGLVGFPSLYWRVLPNPATWNDVQGCYYVAFREDGSQVVLGYEDFPIPIAMRAVTDDLLAMLSITCKPYDIPA